MICKCSNNKYRITSSELFENVVMFYLECPECKNKWMTKMPKDKKLLSGDPGHLKTIEDLHIDPDTEKWLRYD